MSSKTLTGREAAAKAVRAALTGECFAAEKLSELRIAARLDPREAGFAREIALGALRHAHTIDCVLAALARYDRRRVDAKLRALLYTAAHQIIWMQRVPPFAAVDQAVDLARSIASRHAAGMVNALLRKLSEAIESRDVPWQALDPRLVRNDWSRACAFSRPVLPPPDNRQAFLAAATGELESRFSSLVECFGIERAEQIAWASQAVPVTVAHRNPLCIEATAFGDEVRRQFGDTAELVGDTVFLPPSARVIESGLFRAGQLHLQDATARAAATLVGAQPGESLLDLCAAPGGKSIVLAQRMNNDGRVVAADVSADRLALVRENADRLGLSCIETRLADQVDSRAEQFDAVIVDVPCSNTGVIARRPEARFGFTRKKLESLIRLQRELLDKAARRARPGGRLIYSTCSIEPPENEQLVAAFIEANSAWSLTSQESTLPNWGPQLSDWRDGGYAALLHRAD